MSKPARVEPPLAPEATACRTMDEVRAEIDRLDRDIVALIAERTGYVRQAAGIKARRGDIVDPARIEDVVAKACARAQALGLSVQLVEPLYRLLIARSIALETEEFDRQSTSSDG